MRIFLVLVFIYYLEWIFAINVQYEIDEAGIPLKIQQDEHRLDGIEINTEARDAFSVDFRPANRSRRHVARHGQGKKISSRSWKNQRHYHRRRERRPWLGPKFGRRSFEDRESADLEREISDSNEDDEQERDRDNSIDEKSAVWDHWGQWSSCSVTCDTGRRVRWRHCVKNSCPTKGMKQAQMKPCYRRQCSQGLLSWLGIKSKNA